MTDDSTASIFVNDTDNQAEDYPIPDYPIPTGCSRFILPVDLRRALQTHPLSCDLYPRAAGFYSQDPKHGPFTSACFVIYYCIGGKLNLRSATEDWLISSGDIAIIPPGRYHFTASPDSARLTYYWVAFSGKLSTDYTQFISASHRVVHLGLNTELIAQFETLYNLHNLQASVFTLDRFINGANLLKVLLTSIPLTLSRKANQKKGRIDLDRIRRFMAGSLSDPLNLEELAKIVNLSPYHFARTFKKLTGIPPMQYFIQMRLQHACNLLDTTQLPIKQISVAVGYPDPQYFSRIFRRVLGMTPHAYRNKASALSR